MKILFVCPYVPSPLKRRPYNFILHLARRHELHLRVLARVDEIRAAARHAEHLRSQCASAEFLPVSLPMILAGGAWRYAQGDPARTAYTQAHGGYVTLLNRQCDALGIDVVHVDRLRLARLAAGLERPSVVDLPDCMSWTLGQWAAVSSGARALIYRAEARRLRFFEGHTLNDCPLALLASGEDARRVRESGYRGETRSVPGIIELLDDGAVAVAAHAEVPLLVFHGNLSYLPNVYAIVTFVHEVFPTIRAHFPALQLTIVGARPARAVRKLGEIDGVRVVANVERVAPWLRAATAVVAPMRLGAGHSQKVCEAMLAARPVICSPLASHRVAPEVQSRLLVANTAEEWVGHVGCLLADASRAAVVGAEGCEAVRRHYCADAVIPMLEAAYARVSNDRVGCA